MLRRRLGHEDHWHIRRRGDREHCFAATGGRPPPGKRKWTLILLRSQFFFRVEQAFFRRFQKLFGWQRALLSIGPALFLAEVVPKHGLHSFQLVPAFLFPAGVAQQIFSTAALG